MCVCSGCALCRILLLVTVMNENELTEAIQAWRDAAAAERQALVDKLDQMSKELKRTKENWKSVGNEWQRADERNKELLLERDERIEDWNNSVSGYRVVLGIQLFVIVVLLVALLA